MNLNHPDAGLLLGQLQEILKSIREACRSDKEFAFPSSASELASIIDALQRYLPERKRGAPASFWECVKALEKARPGLHIENTLKRLFDRVSKTEPGPLTRLLNSATGSGLTRTKRRATVAIRDALDAGKFPAVHRELLPLLLTVVSDPFTKELDSAMPRSTRNLHQDRLITHCAYLDIAWQHRQWLQNHSTNVEAAYDLAVVLEHQPFLDVFKPLLFGKHFNASTLANSRKLNKDRDRARKYREKQKTITAKRPKRAKVASRKA